MTVPILFHHYSNMKSKIKQFYKDVRHNLWHKLFYIFCRFSLALGFIAAGYVKIIGERFASGLAVKHPMGAYLEALHHTGFYYPFIGIAQILAGIFLIIPRTVILGALLYFPIIVNIWILSWAVRFEGSLFTSTLMVFANLYILLYNYDRLKFILPLKSEQLNYTPFRLDKYSKKFPFKFFIAVFLIAVGTLVSSNKLFELMPRNSYKDCSKQFNNNQLQNTNFDFCDCIHYQGKSLDECLNTYEKTK